MKKFACLPPFLIAFYFLLFHISSFPPYVYATTSSPAATSVSATILNPPGAYSITVSAEPSDKVDPGADVVYTITYSNGGDIDAVEVKIVAVWGFETDEVADYVLGSATTAYNEAVPTVDVLNRTITWSIPVLPAQTLDQTTSFRLRTHLTHPFTGTYKFFAEASLLVSEVTMVTSPRQTNSVTYLEAYPSGILPPELEKLSILDVKILEITAHHAKILWVTNKPASSEIRYGLSRAYGLNISDPTWVKEHTFSLDNLTPDTLYHFQVISEIYEERVESEDFVFKTAREVEVVPTADIGALLVRSFNLRLSPDTQGKVEVYPNITVDFELPIYGVDISAVLDLGGRIISLLSQEQIFTGSTKTPLGIGEYPIRVRIEDKSGNFFDQPLITLVVQPIPRVLDFSGKPIEGAKVTLYRFNPFVNRFTIFDLSSFHQENPISTNGQGEYRFLVPYGRYFLTVSAAGYQAHRSDTIVVLKNGIFGENIVLKPVPVGIIERIIYEIRRFLRLIFQYISDLVESLVVARLVEKLALPLLIVSLFTSLWVFLDRLGLSPSGFSSLLISFSKRPIFWLTKKTPPVWGVVLDQTTGDPLRLVEVKVFEKDGTKHWGTTFTNSKGEFGFTLPYGTYLLSLRKIGFLIPQWELAKGTKQRLANAVFIDWTGLKGERLKIWLKPGEVTRGYRFLSSLYALFKGVFFELADFWLITGLIISLLNLKYNFGMFNLLITFAYIILAIFWALLAFGRLGG
jgi:hypothetical protein